MCNIEQCSSCRLDCDTCGHYDHTDPAPCNHFVKPIDNSKMFSRWYKFSGRIGRLECILTFAISILLYFNFSFAMAQLALKRVITIESMFELYIFMTIFAIVALLLPVYIMLATAIKRAHDLNIPIWFALIPVVAFLCIAFTIIPDRISVNIFLVGWGVLFMCSGEDRVNEHGSNPGQPYSEQILL